MNGLCHLIAVTAVLCILMALASGYSLQQPANTATEELMERRSATEQEPCLTISQLLDLLELYEGKGMAVKRQMRQTGLNSIDKVSRMYYNQSLNKMLADLQQHVKRR